MLTLYYAPGACSMASHIALEEAGASYEEHQLGPGGQHEEWYVKDINPRAQVPALRVDGTVLTENVAILLYVARNFPQANLLPADPFTQAQCISNMAWFASGVHPWFGHIVRPERYAGNDTAAQAVVKEMASKVFFDRCREIDSKLGGKRWMMGDQYTLADPYALVFYGWCLRVGLPAHELTNYTAFKNRMKERAAVRKVLEGEKSPILTAA